MLRNTAIALIVQNALLLIQKKFIQSIRQQYRSLSNFVFLDFFDKCVIFSKRQSIELANRMIKTTPMMKMIGFNYEFYRPSTNVAIYKTFIRSRGDYGLAILPKPDLKLLQRCQNRAIIIVLNTSMFSL